MFFELEVVCITFKKRPKVCVGLMNDKTLLKEPLDALITFD